MPKNLYFDDERYRFNNQTGSILVHIYPLFINTNLHVKYRSNLIRTFWVEIKKYEQNKIKFGVMLGPYIQSRGTRVTEMSANADLTTVETYMYVQQGEQFENQFFIYVPKCKKMYILGYLGALRGSSIIRLGLYSFAAILSPISMYLSNKEAIW